MLEQTLCDNFTAIVVSIIQRDWHVNYRLFPSGNENKFASLNQICYHI